MSHPKRHHFVPQMLLRNFADNDGLLWYFDKNKPNFQPVKRHPRSIFYLEEYYSIPLRTGGIDASVEKDLSKLEQSTASIIEKICTSVRAGRLPRLTAEEKRTWCKFVFTQWKRTPDSISGKMQLEEVRKSIGQEIDNAESYGIRINDNVKRELFTEQALLRILKGVRARSALDHLGNVEGILNDMGLCFAHITKPNKAFIISSAPVAKLTPSETTHLGDENVELWLPISSDIAVSPIPKSGEALNARVSDFQLRGLNLAIYEQSQQIAARSKDLIQSLLTNR